jgi:hypothetical protein
MLNIKVSIKVPIFRDTNTPEYVMDQSDKSTAAAALKCLELDSMAYGMGSCCMQVWGALVINIVFHFLLFFFNSTK